VNFQVQAQPLQWVEIESIPLAPRGEVAGDKGSTNQFGPAVELRLAGRIDFDTGETTADTHKADGAAVTGNPEAPGFDAEFRRNALRFFGTTYVNLAPADWQLATPESLGLLLREKASKPVELALAEGELPITGGYRTREGGVGIMQILDFTPTRDAVTLRFKRPH